MLDSKQLGNLSDSDLLAKSRTYEAFVTANASDLNLVTADSDAMKGVNNAFEASQVQKGDLENQLDGVIELNAENRQNVLREWRRQRNVLYADTSISDNVLASAGLPPRDTTKTDAPKPTTAPIGWVDYGKLKHTIHFRDSATPDKKAKPEGMKGCEIWYFIGSTAPTSEKDWDYLTTDSNSPYIAFYEAADAGKKVFYQLRWISKSDERGEWSETIEATING
jgi:hypothetical protein